MGFEVNLNVLFNDAFNTAQGVSVQKISTRFLQNSLIALESVLSSDRAGFILMRHTFLLQHVKDGHICRTASVTVGFIWIHQESLFQYQGHPSFYDKHKRHSADWVG